jgi:hypothetical protein
LQPRRILLFFAILLLVSAAAASFVPPPDETGREPGGTEEQTEATGRPPAAEATGRPPASEADRDGASEVEFSAEPDPRRREREGPPTESVGVGEHVIVTVEAAEAGQVELEGLGRIDTVEPRTPAEFDLLTDARGRFPVVYIPVQGEHRTVGTLVVAKPSP